MSASFNSLPAELVMDIVRHADHPDRPCNRPCPTQSTLAALSKTSKLLNFLATTRLYRAPRYRHSKWPLFARTLIARKDLAALVKDVCFHGSQWDDRLDPDTFPEEVAKHYNLETSPDPVYPLNDHGLDDDDDDDDDVWSDDEPNTYTLFEADVDGEPDSYIEMAFILHFCSESVETIYVNLQLCYEGFDILGPPKSLPALKALEFGYDDAVEGFEVPADECVTGWLLDVAAQNLERLQLCRVMFWPALKCPLEGLTHLVLKSSALCYEQLDRMLSCVPNLERFEYQGAPVTEGEYEVFNLDEAFGAIKENCKRLKSFVMRVSDDEEAFGYLPEGQLEQLKAEFASSGIEFTLIEE